MGLWCVTVQTGCSRSSLTAQSIHLREKNIVGPTERSKNAKHFSSSKEGPAFFDEDDVCVVSQTLNSLSELLLPLALIRKKALTKEAYAIIMTARSNGASYVFAWEMPLLFFDSENSS